MLTFSLVTNYTTIVTMDQNFCHGHIVAKKGISGTLQMELQHNPATCNTIPNMTEDEHLHRCSCCCCCCCRIRMLVLRCIVSRHKSQHRRRRIFAGLLLIGLVHTPADTWHGPRHPHDAVMAQAELVSDIIFLQLLTIACIGD